MTLPLTPEEAFAEGRRRERADVLAYLERKIGAAERQGKFRDDGAALMAGRLSAVTAAIGAALHEGEADIG
jgi:hypothetical protein